MCTITPNWPASKSVKNRLLSKSVDVDLQCFMVMYFPLYIVSLVCKMFQYRLQIFILLFVKPQPLQSVRNQFEQPNDSLQ